jgi:hypothetical protein
LLLLRAVHFAYCNLQNNPLLETNFVAASKDKRSDCRSRWPTFDTPP